MSFGDVSSPSGLQELNNYLKTRSYIEGFTFSAADLKVFKNVPFNVNATTYPNVARWYRHIRAIPEYVVNNLGGCSSCGCADCQCASCGCSDAKSPAAKPAKSPAAKPAKSPAAKPAKSPAAKPAKSPAAKPAKSPAKSPAKKAEKAEEEEEDNGFSLDDDEDDAAAAAAIAAKKKQEAEATTKKDKKVVETSNVIFDVKPEGLETDMAQVEKDIRAIEMDGLSWRGSELVKVAYGIKKLRIIAHIVDELVSVDELQEGHMEKVEGVQSVDVFAFNKN